MQYVKYFLNVFTSMVA